MVVVQHQASLKTHHTFGAEIRARLLAGFDSVEQLRELLREYPEMPRLVVGEGSNLLFTRDFEGLVLVNRIKGIEIVSKQGHNVEVAVGSGENWHQFVLWALDQGFGGVENLSLIPGTAGAAPVQNIGAYGVELKDVFLRLEAVELATGKLMAFSLEDCRFGYRDSIFKTELKGLYCITRVFVRLSTEPVLHLEYGALRQTLAEMGVEHPTAREVSTAVVKIRSEKLPDPRQLGNAGSFFKNPEVDTAVYEDIHARFPNLIAYPLPDGRYKIPAGWLIEQCGWKGKRQGSVGSYDKQSLVIVNYGGATGEEVWAFSQAIARSVYETFAIRLEPEVNIL